MLEVLEEMKSDLGVSVVSKCKHSLLQMPDLGGS